MKKIKYKLVINKRIKHYLLYAVGELILISVGILVAMQINNWNEKRKVINKANLYISEVKKDLALDTVHFSKALKRIELKIDYKKKLLVQDSLSELSTTNIQQILTSGTNNVSINNGSYNKIVESGILTLSEKKYLFEKLNIYYLSFNNYLKEYNEWEENSYRKDIDFWIYQDNYEIRYFNSSYSELKKKNNRKNLMKMVNSKIGRNHINMSILREESMQSMYTKVKIRAKALIGIIDSIQN